MKHIRLFESEGKCTVVKPPSELPTDGKRSVFLAGSIEMGKAEDWQAKVTELLAGEDVYVFNPRRDDWDSSWEQSIKNDNFRGQVEWELEALDRATVIVMYLDPNTKSPISLLVCCPDGFYRKGNVDIVCARYGIPAYDTVEDLAAAAIVKMNAI